jgi:hypothetical protein
MRNRILLTMIVGTVLLLGGFLFWQNFSLQENFLKKAEAGNVYDVEGWAWSDTIGWVSFNCLDGGPARNDICGASNYGVSIDDNTGKFSGYAWSDNIGWISFRQSDLIGCPSGSCIAEVNLDTGEVDGWARAINATDNSYGWIQLDHGKSGEVTIDPITGYFDGYGWGGGPKDEAVIGWLFFDTAYPVNVDPIVFNTPPYTENRDVNIPLNDDFCENDASYVLSWNFRDDDAPYAYEQSFEVEITNSSSGSSDVYSENYGPDIIKDQDPQTVNLDVNISEDLAHDPPVVGYGDNYTWRVRVQDDFGVWSTWEAGPGFNVPEDYPECSFTMDPTKPNITEEISFTDTSTSSAYNIIGWSWDFGSDTSSIQDPTYTYYEVGEKTVTLEITDAGGRSCSCSKTFKARPGSPDYIEVIPR